MVKTIVPIKQDIETVEEPTQEVSNREKLSEELDQAALSLLMVCNSKLKLHGEDINLTELKEITKVVKDVRTSFFDVKQSQTTSNTQINISGSSIQFFQGVLNNGNSN